MHVAFAERLSAARQRAAGGAPLVVVCDETTVIPSSFLLEQRSPGAQACRLDGLSDKAKVALGLLGEALRFGVEVPSEHAPLVKDGPFLLKLEGDGSLVLVVLPNACHHPRMGGGICHAWAEALVVPGVQVDLTAVTHLNSVLIAWMLQLVQAFKPAPFRISGASAAVATQLRQLRLDYVMKMV